MQDLYPMRLQKYLARAGAASRRGSEDLMTAGRVTVNGQVVTLLGSKVDPLVDEVCVDGVPIHLTDGNSYLMLNKPAGYLTTMDDPQGRPTVVELLPAQRAPGLFPVGRLDYDTTGLLLFATDGEFAHQVLHPKHHVPKRYIATVDGVFTQENAQQLEQGVVLNDGLTKPAVVTILSKKQDAALNDAHLKQFKKLNTNERIKAAAGELPVVTTTVAITISEGRKRQVKRMFAHVGRPVLTLHRQQFGPLDLGDLAEGHTRELTAQEIQALKDAVYKENV